MGDDSDTLFAWSCAANLLLYDEDPGPRSVEIAGGGESRRVDRREALVDVYARQLLVEAEADLTRLDVAEAACRRRAADTRTLRWSRDTARHRRQQMPATSSWAGRVRHTLHVLAAYTPSARREIAEVWDVAAELAKAAAQRVADAGAVDDRKARERLLAATHHTLTADILGGFLPDDLHQQRATELAADLDEIDRRPES